MGDGTMPSSSPEGPGSIVSLDMVGRTRLSRLRQPAAGAAGLCTSKFAIGTPPRRSPGSADAVVVERTEEGQLGSAGSPLTTQFEIFEV